METKRSKYDTNPLDPEVEQNAAESWGENSGGAPTKPVTGITGDVAAETPSDSRKNFYSEAPTRRYDNTPLETPYQSVFVPPTYAPPTQYQPGAQQPQVNTVPTSRTVSGIGLPEKWAMMLPYAPMYVGLVVSLIELFLVPRREVRVRFHASQGIALHIAILMVQTVFSVISTLTDSSLGGLLFKVAALVFLIISMIRVWRGEPHRIAPLAEPAQWFNEHIDPRNQS